MVSHYIILSSSYSEGKRIALDYIINFSNIRTISKAREKIIKECGDDVSYSTHVVQSDDETWKSLCKADGYFDDVQVIDNVDEFIRLIKIDRKLSALDVAKYILSTTKCTQLKLQKLLYYCYADYLVKYNKKLFDEDILAYKYGPVVKSVLEKYSKYKYDEIEESPKYDINAKKIKEMPAKSRIMFAEDGLTKVLSIDETINKYGHYSANELVTLTHRIDTPWSKCHINDIFTKIDDETILHFHKNEVV